MLVINANNTQDITNSFLWIWWYPDLNSILMRGCPNYTITPTSSKGRNFGGAYSRIYWPDDIQIVKTVWTYKINMFSHRANKQMLYSWQSFQTPAIASDNLQYLPDFWFFHSQAWTNINTWNIFQKLELWYNLAVEWLKAGQVVWEKIYAPFVMWWNLASVNTFIFDPYKTTQGSIWWIEKYYASDLVDVTFKLLHTDWTTTTIASIPLLPKYNYWQTLSTQNLNAYFSQVTPYAWTVNVNNWTVYRLCSRNNDWRISKYCFEWSYDWAWQVAQDGDILVAEVRTHLARLIYSVWATKDTFGIFWWWSNNNNMRDFYWFRPFQVSIRDA